MNQDNYGTMASVRILRVSMIEASSITHAFELAYYTGDNLMDGDRRDHTEEAASQQGNNNKESTISSGNEESDVNRGKERRGLSLRAVVMKTRRILDLGGDRLVRYCYLQIVVRCKCVVLHRS